MSHRIAGLALVAAISLSACGRDEPAATVPAAGNDSPAASSSAPASASPQTSSPDNATSQVSEHRELQPTAPMSFGEDCDRFLQKYAACMQEKAPDRSRRLMNMSLRTWQSTWRALAASPTTSSQIAQSCRTAQENVRSQMASFGCEP